MPRTVRNRNRHTETLRQFIQFVVTQGQDEAESLFYAKLPPPLQQQDQTLLAQVGTEHPPTHAQLVIPNGASH
jgi:hypothetical protein